jgi:hypothetical protein
MPGLRQKNRRPDRRFFMPAGRAAPLLFDPDVGGISNALGKPVFIGVKKETMPSFTVKFPGNIAFRGGRSSVKVPAGGIFGGHFLYSFGAIHAGIIGYRPAAGDC